MNSVIPTIHKSDSRKLQLQSVILLMSRSMIAKTGARSTSKQQLQACTYQYLFLVWHLYHIISRFAIESISERPIIPRYN
eukprot:scaffold4056_cov86-Skeletonema_dohrnii-CCMP3373.AAC.2